jgi:hypothetical protein
MFIEKLFSINISTRRVGEETLIEFFKNLISFPLNLRSHGKSCDLAINLINKVNKIVALRGAIGLLRFGKLWKIRFFNVELSSLYSNKVD